MRRLAYDETGEKVTVPGVGLSAEQAASTWQVMVSRLELVAGWAGQKVVKGSIVVPSLLVASPNSEDIYNLLYYHKILQPMQAALTALANLARWAVCLHETEGAYACERLWAFLTGFCTNQRLLECRFICRLHATQD